MVNLLGVLAYLSSLEKTSLDLVKISYVFTYIYMGDSTNQGPV